MSFPADRYRLASQEDRSAPRAGVYLPAMLRPSGSAAFATTIVDLSRAGFAVRAVTGMRPGVLCWLSVGPLKGLQSEVRWNDGELVGCAFATMLNQAVFEALLRL